MRVRASCGVVKGSTDTDKSGAEDGHLTVEHEFDRRIAGRGSLLNDLQIDPEGRYVYIADTSPVAHSPGFVVYDAVFKLSFRSLERDVSVFMEKRLSMQVNYESVSLMGLLPLKFNLDSIALDHDGPQTSDSRQGSWSLPFHTERLFSYTLLSSHL